MRSLQAIVKANKDFSQVRKTSNRDELANKILFTDKKVKNTDDIEQRIFEKDFEFFVDLYEQKIKS